MGQKPMPGAADVDQVIAVGAVAMQEHDQLARRAAGARLEPRTIELGRRKLGLGEEWVAERLPKMIADAGFTEIKVFVNDRVWPCFPPYDTPEQVMIVGEKPDSEAASAYRAETRRCVLAGGLDAAACDSAWALIEEIGRREDAARADGSLSYCGPGSHFIFAARKPA